MVSSIVKEDIVGAALDLIYAKDKTRLDLGLTDADGEWVRTEAESMVEPIVWDCIARAIEEGERLQTYKVRPDHSTNFQIILKLSSKELYIISTVYSAAMSRPEVGEHFSPLNPT